MPREGHTALPEPWPMRSESAEIVRKALQRYWETLANLIFLLLSATRYYFSLMCVIWNASPVSTIPLPRRVWEQCTGVTAEAHQFGPYLPSGRDHCLLGYLQVNVLHLPALETQAWPAESFSRPILHLWPAFSFLKSSKFWASKVNRAFLIPTLTIN